MPTSPAVPPPLKTEMLDADGFAVRAWAAFFNSLHSKQDKKSSSTVVLTVDGTLAIGSDLAPRISLPDDITTNGVRLQVKQAPTGAGLTVEIKQGTTLWITLTIAAGQTSVVATEAQLQAAALIPASTNIRIDVTAVGTTFPGADLTVMIDR